MKILNGTKEAEKILNEIKKEVKEKDLSPTLAVILVGENKSSKIYIKKKREKAGKVGINIGIFKFPPMISQKEIIKKIEDLNQDKDIDGIIVQLPLPSKFNTKKVISSIDPKKDVDGFHKTNLKLLKKENKKPFLYPVLPQTIYLALKKSNKNLKESKITAIVNSDIFGKTLKLFLKEKNIKVHYIKEVKNDILRKSDIIISVKGKKRIITDKNIKEGAAIIDAGFNHDKNGNAVGDADREKIKEKASFLTPVPGGIGPLTVAFLLKNTYLANIQK